MERNTWKGVVMTSNDFFFVISGQLRQLISVRLIMRRRRKEMSRSTDLVFVNNLSQRVFNNKKSFKKIQDPFKL